MRDDMDNCKKNPNTIGALGAERVDQVAMVLGRTMPALRRLTVFLSGAGPDGLSAQDAEALKPVARACERALAHLQRPRGGGYPIDPMAHILEAQEAVEVVAEFVRALRDGMTPKADIGAGLAMQAREHDARDGRSTW